MAKTIDKAILGVLLVLILGIGSILVTAAVTNKKSSDLVSSMQVDDKEEVSEAQESAQLTALAKISTDDAKAIALSAVNTNEVGEVTDAEIENEDGNVVYTVEFKKNGIETDVKIDAGNGKVLLIENDKTETDTDKNEGPDNEDDQDD